jgi:hypothetical protein
MNTLLTIAPKAPVVCAGRFEALPEAFTNQARGKRCLGERIRADARDYFNSKGQ